MVTAAAPAATTPGEDASEDHVEEAGPRRYDLRSLEIGAIVAASAITAMFGPAAPTGLLVVDVVYRAAVGALVAYAGSRATRWTLVVVAAASLLAARDWWQVPAAASVIVAVWDSFQPRARRRAGALAAGLAVQGLLHWSSFAFHGAPTLCAVAVCVPFARPVALKL